MKLSKNLVAVKLASFAQKRDFNRKVVEIISSDLFWILVIGGSFRLFYYFLLADFKHSDSATYLNYSSNIFKGEVDVFRTPVYPYFLKTIKIFGELNFVRNIAIVQSVISFITIIIFYKIVSTLFNIRKVIVTATLVYATMLPIINFDKAILTESLSISGMVIFILLIISYLKKQTILKAIIITLHIFLITMLRPFNIVLLPLMIVFWITRIYFFKKDKKMCLWGLASSLFVILLILGYSNLNKTNNHFYGISIVTNINQLDIIIGSNMYKNGNDPELSNIITKNINKPGTQDDYWRFIYNINKLDPKRVSDFIKNCIKNQPHTFIKRILKSSAELQTDNLFPIYVIKKEGLLPRLVIDIEYFIFFTTFNKVTIFLCFDFIFMLINWVRFKKVSWLNIILWFIIVSQIAAAIIGAQREYQRLIVAIIPCLIIIIFCYIDRICYAIDLNKLNNK